MSPDLSGILASTGVSLEQEALTQFGAAVGGIGDGMLKNIFGLGTPSQEAISPNLAPNGVYDITQYAAALVRPDQVDFNPKLKFLFKISFKFDPDLLDAARVLGYDLTEIEQNAQFMIRHIDRPKFDYQYEEVNLYNFRTKVLKQIGHREMGFTLYDDVGNHVLNFVNVYRKLLQPIARMRQDPSMPHGDHGFNFDKTLTGLDTSMRGVLPGASRQIHNILQSMTIHQIFVERGSREVNPASWVKRVDFVFTNPRFTNIDIDDMDHENGSNFNLVTITSDFDTMFMDEPRAYHDGSTPRPPEFPGGDIGQGGNLGIVSGLGPQNPEGRARNPFIDIIANQAGRFAQQATSNALYGSLSTTPGGAALASGLTGVGSTIGEASRVTLGGGSRISVVQPAIVTDDSISTPQISNLSSRS